jgi:hypothetical protein
MKWNSPLKQKMYGDGRNHVCNNTDSRSQSTMGAGLQMCYDTMFDNTSITTKYEHIQ